MDESRLSNPESGTSDTRPENEAVMSDRGAVVRLAVWGVLSLAFIAFLAFGSVNARIWRFGQLEIESKSILQIWRIQGQNLPDVSNGWLLQALFYGSVIVFVGCIVLGMRYLLDPAIEEAPDGVPGQS